MSNETYSVSEFAAAIGEKVRTIQFWTDAGVLHPIGGTAKTGKGTHRRFAESEFRVARVAAKMAKMNSPISEIIEVASRIRVLGIVSSSDEALSNLQMLHGDINRAINGERGPSTSEMARVCLDVLSITGLAGAFDGPVDLHISYFALPDGELRTRILFWSALGGADKLATAVPGVLIGYKVIRFDTASDLRGYDVSEDLKKELVSAFLATLRLLKTVAPTPQRDLIALRTALSNG